MISVCSDIVEVVSTLMGCPRARCRSECDDIYAGRAKVVWSHSATYIMTFCAIFNPLEG